MSTTRFRSRRGITLVELLVAMTLLGFIGVSILRTFTSQARLVDMHAKRLDARATSRAPVNMLMSEARMVEIGSGVVAATASSVTLRVPVAMGLVCGNAGGTTVLSLMPTDSVMLASAALSGHAYRQASGTYTYNEATTSIASGGTGTCNAANITKVDGGLEVVVTPQMPAGLEGSVAFLYQRVRYDFAASTLMPGRTGLWRTLEKTGATEELAAPFDATARFRFYRIDEDTARTVVPPLGEIRGLELRLVGASVNKRFGKTTPETSRLQTAVFFTNRLN